MAPAQLNSWKELAAYLGCSVRTVQRWEKERGLPVRRIPGERGQIFALAAEVDAWKHGRTDLVAEDAPIDPAADGWRARYRLAAAVGITVAAIALTIATTGLLRRTASGAPIRPTSFALERGTLLAFDPAGRLMWSYAFGVPVEPLDLTWRPTLGEWVRRIDVDADGNDEVVVIIGTRSDHDLRETIHVFDLDGTLRWVYAPNLELQFGDTTYRGPWVVLDLEVVPQHGLWVSVSDRVWWPSAVVRLDGSGRAETAFVQPGNVRVIRAMTVADRTLVAAAGVNNEWASATLALLDPNAAAAAPPQGTPAFACRNCPTGQPLRYLLLAPSALSRALRRPYNTAVDLQIGATVDVTTYESDQGANVFFLLNRDFELVAARPTDGYWSAARARQVADGDALMSELRSWSPRGWTAARVRYDAVGLISGRQ